jgi:SGNH domain-containing protein
LRRTAVAALLAATIGLALCIPVHALSAGSKKPGTLQQVKTLVRASVKIQSLSSAVQAALPSAGTDNAGIVYDIPSNCEIATQCVYGDASASQSVVLYGDSHAEMWLPAILPLLTADKLKLVFIGQRGCPVVLITTPDRFTGCAAPRLIDLSVINAIKPLAVILANRTSYGFTRAEWQAGMTATLSALAPSLAKIVVIGDIQVFNASVPVCLTANPSSVQKCAVSNPNTKLPGQQAAERAAARAAGASYINPIPWLCTTARCSPVIGSDIAYWDAYHLSVTYAKYLARVMGVALQSTI